MNNDEDQVTELTHEELIGIFELAYDSKSALAGEIPVDTLIKQELHIMPYFVAPNKQLPEDYEDQYRAWRPVETQEPEQQQTSQNTTSTTNDGGITQGKPQGSTQQGKPQGGGQPSGDSGTGPIIEDDGSSGLTTGIETTDPSVLTEGIDPNQNPWDVQGEIFYGGG